MQTQPLISVIVPVYKAEKFLPKCIDSILSQTYTNFELLLIDDGSPDNSGKICDEYASKDSRVRVFHKQNGGVSSARNLGLREARGEWISWVDADDWIEQNMLELVINQIQYGADLVIFNFYMVKDSSVEIYEYKFNDAPKQEFIKKYINDIWTVLWTIFAKKELYLDNRIYFSEDISFWEDFEVATKILFFSKKIIYLNETLYYYNRSNQNSILENLSYKQIKEQYRATLYLIDFFSEKKSEKIFMQELSWRILRSKQLLVLDYNTWPEFYSIYPQSHEYILNCPFLNKKIKIIMWCMTHYRLKFISKGIIFMRKVLNR